MKNKVIICYSETLHSFPRKEDGEKIQKMGHHIFSFRDLRFLFKSSKLSYLGEK